MKNDQDDRQVELLEEATDLLNESDAKTTFMLCEAASRDGHIASPDVCRFLDQVSAISHGKLLELEGAEPIIAARDGVELPSAWSEVEWPTTYKDLDYIRQLFHRWAVGMASQKKAYFFRMVGACAMARAGRVKKEMRELKRMTRSMVVYWEGEADQLGLPK